MVPERVCARESVGAIGQRRTNAILSEGRKRRGGASGRYITGKYINNSAAWAVSFVVAAVEKLLRGQLAAPAESSRASLDRAVLRIRSAQARVAVPT